MWFLFVCAMSHCVFGGRRLVLPLNMLLCASLDLCSGHREAPVGTWYLEL